jgi:hypothetical protein
MSLSQHSGGFALPSIESKGPWLISFHVREMKTTTEPAGSIKVRRLQTLTVTSFTIRPLPPGAVIAEIALDAAERTRVIDGTIAFLQANRCPLAPTQSRCDSCENCLQYMRIVGNA